VTATATTFSSLDPRTGEVVGTYPVHDAAAVETAVARAVEGARWWAELGFDGRARRLREWKKALVRGLDGLARTISDETGKPFDDARLELALAVEHLDWAARHAAKTLGRRRVRAGLLMANQAAVWRKKSLLPGKFTNALLANVEFPMTTMAGRGFPSTGDVLGASAPAMGSGPLMSAFSSRAMTRPVAFITARLLGDVRAS